MTVLGEKNSPTRTNPSRLSFVGRRLVRRLIDDDGTFLRRVKHDPRTGPVADRLIQDYREELLESLRQCLEDSARHDEQNAQTDGEPKAIRLSRAADTRLRNAATSISPVDWNGLPHFPAPGGFVRTVSDAERPPLFSLSTEERGSAIPPGDPPKTDSAAADDFRPEPHRDRRRLRRLLLASSLAVAVTFVWAVWSLALSL